MTQIILNIEDKSLMGRIMGMPHTARLASNMGTRESELIPILTDTGTHSDLFG